MHQQDPVEAEAKARDLKDLKSGADAILGVMAMFIEATTEMQRALTNFSDFLSGVVERERAKLEPLRPGEPDGRD